jgi:alkylated DNA nucleotide flippase Atl1
MDKDLNASDVKVYGALAYYSYQGTVAKKSYVDLAEVASVSARQVARSLPVLIERRHIVAAEWNAIRHVGTYHLTSPVFGQKQRSGQVEEVVSSPSRGRRLASVRVA